MKFCDTNFWFKILNSEIYMQKWLNCTIYSFYYNFAISTKKESQQNQQNWFSTNTVNI